MKNISLIKDAYDSWLENGWGDRSLLPLDIIIAICNQNTLDGYDELPDWTKNEMSEFFNKYRTRGELILITSNGKRNYSQLMKRADELFGSVED